MYNRTHRRRTQIEKITSLFCCSHVFLCLLLVYRFYMEHYFTVMWSETDEEGSAQQYKYRKGVPRWISYMLDGSLVRYNILILSSYSSAKIFSMFIACIRILSFSSASRNFFSMHLHWCAFGTSSFFIT